jgi:hypothetical protein
VLRGLLRSEAPFPPPPFCLHYLIEYYSNLPRCKFHRVSNRGNANRLSQQNAKTDGMDRDLGFVGNQYNTMLSIFYVPYVVFAPPIAMIGKKYGPSKVLPILMFCFGSATLLAASVKNWSGMMALRWFLGTSDPPTRIRCCLDDVKKLT